MNDDWKKKMDEELECAQTAVKRKEFNSRLRFVFWSGIAVFGLYKLFGSVEYMGYLEGYENMTAMLKDGLVESLKAFKEVK